VYMVRCADGSLYVGYANNPEVREIEHNAGQGARYTAMRRPVRLVYTEAFQSVETAARRSLFFHPNFVDASIVGCV
jgi:putative endonuclease